ncbi:MAG: hypothetical protein JO000_22220 [Alphaproteobacteria bacterium]|nr:hypothetical protein [Alphaproteobacteria bacterium]
MRKIGTRFCIASYQCADQIRAWPHGGESAQARLLAPSTRHWRETDRPVILHCASGGRAALAGKLLKDMGYQKVFNLGGFKDWVEAGGKVEK